MHMVRPHMQEYVHSRSKYTTQEGQLHNRACTWQGHAHSGSSHTAGTHRRKRRVHSRGTQWEQAYSRSLPDAWNCAVATPESLVPS